MLAVVGGDRRNDHRSFKRDGSDHNVEESVGPGLTADSQQPSAAVAVSAAAAITIRQRRRSPVAGARRPTPPSRRSRAAAPADCVRRQRRRRLISTDPTAQTTHDVCVWPVCPVAFSFGFRTAHCTRGSTAIDVLLIVPCARRAHLRRLLVIFLRQAMSCSRVPCALSSSSSLPQSSPNSGTSSRGVATGETGVDMYIPLLPEGGCSWN